jgi:large subunit ribosomal protein L24
MEKLKVGDTVQVTRGAERTQKASRGKIQFIDRKAERVRVEGIRLVTTHVKKGRDRTNPDGGRIEKTGSVALASVTLVCPKCDKATRVGVRVVGERKVRFCKKCDAAID